MRELEMTEVSAKAANQIEGIGQYLGPSTQEDQRGQPFGFAATIHDAPIALSAREIFTSSGVPITLPIYDRFDLWLVPHRFSVTKKFGMGTIDSAGCDVEYSDNQGTLSIVSLFPCAQFVKRTPVGVIAKLDATAVLSQSGLNELISEQATDAFEANVSVNMQGFGLKIRFGKEMGISLRLEIPTPLVLASGTGASTCQFLFMAGEEPIFGRDLETWAVVAAHKRLRELKYRMRVCYVAKRLFIPRRWETAWADLTAIRG
jgi:hypothetical protein